MLGHQHREDGRHGLAIGSLEGYGRGGTHERAHRLLEGLDAAMRYRDAVAEPRGAELLAVEEAVEDARARNLARVLEEQPDLLEQPLLAARLHVEQHMARRQQPRNQVARPGGALGDHGFRAAPYSCARFMRLIPAACLFTWK